MGRLSQREREQRLEGYLKIKRQLLEHVVSVPESYRNQVGWTEERGMGNIYGGWSLSPGDRFHTGPAHFINVNLLKKGISL